MRRFMVTDSRKLSFFSHAARVRAGLSGLSGPMRHLGEDSPPDEGNVSYTLPESIPASQTPGNSAVEVAAGADQKFNVTFTPKARNLIDSSGPMAVFGPTSFMSKAFAHGAAGTAPTQNTWLTIGSGALVGLGLFGLATHKKGLGMAALVAGGLGFGLLAVSGRLSV